MRDAISDRKWIYIAVGIIGVVLSVVPLARTDTFNFVLFNYDTGLKYVLAMAVWFPIFMVLTNALYAGVYKEDYYNQIHKIMAVLLPIAGILILIFFKEGLKEFDLTGMTYTPMYYILFAYLIGFYGFHIYICFTKVY